MTTPAYGNAQAPLEHDVEQAVPEVVVKYAAARESGLACP
jgi:hypothetical protein